MRGRTQGDIVDHETRSRMMRAVRQRNTEPELMVRKHLTALGTRYRLNVRGIPGSPDIANQTRGWAIYVHGCFWHGHANCRKTKGGTKGRIPRQNRPYWAKKIAENRERDARKVRAARQLGLRTLVVWECELPNTARLRAKLRRFVDGTKTLREAWVQKSQPTN